jgi:DNA polymerase
VAADEARDELRELAGMARELLAWEEALAGGGVPDVQVSADRAESPARTEASAETSGGPRVASAQRRARLEVLAAEAAACTRCDLHTGRTKSVFARGNPDAELAFVGEGPGYHEDQQGLPFVGKAGQLLDKMIVAMGYGRDDVYVCNVVKCRPPDNRTPLPNETAACLPYLEQQLASIQPKVVVALGRTAAQGLGLIDETTRGWRGAWRTWNGIAVMSTYHPAFLLRSPEMKRPVWEDLQKVMARLGKAPPPKKR